MANYNNRPPRLAQPGVLVVGMHRSGTSAATRILHLLGLSIGPPDRLMPPGKDNPAGYWESRTLTAFNDQLLLTLGGTWSALPSTQAGWEHDPDVAVMSPAAYRIAEAFFGDRPWVWKDPRVCILLPFWRRILRGSAILVLRNPIDIAGSLATRNGFTLELGLAIWERSMRRAAEGLRGMPTWVGSYESLLADPADWTGNVTEFLTSEGFPVEATRTGLAAQSVQAGLRHHAGSKLSNTSVPGQADVVNTLYGWLRSLSGPHQRFLPDEIGPEPDYVEDLIAAHRTSLAELPWQRGRQLLARGQWSEARPQLRAAATHPRADSGIRFRAALGIAASLLHTSLEPITRLKNRGQADDLRSFFQELRLDEPGSKQ